MGLGWGGGQGGCEWRSEAFVKIQKKCFFFLGGGVQSGGVRLGVGSGGGGLGDRVGGQGGCEWRSEAFVKIQKKMFFFGGGPVRGGSGWEVRVDGNGELKLL